MNCELMLKIIALLVSVGGAIWAAVWAVIQFSDSRKRDITWKRTELLFRIGEQLDSNPRFIAALGLLEDRDHRTQLQEFFEFQESDLLKDGKDLRQNLDALFNLFERIAHAVYVTKTLSIDEASCFGWYLQRILDTEPLKKYCEENGFEDVLKLAQEVVDKTQKG